MLNIEFEGREMRMVNLPVTGIFIASKKHLFMA